MALKNKTKFYLRVGAAIVTFASIYFLSPWEYALYYFSPLPDTIQEVADEAVERELAGIILYVHKKGQAPEFYASGWHDRQNKIPAYPQALFKIASIGKLYDASVIARLVANGTLSLDETLANYMPELVGRIANAERITLRMMVQHRSGIPNFTDHKDYSWSESSLDVLALVLDMPADFEPDTDYSYSNTNYLLLQKIVTRVLGYSHHQYIQQDLLAPLGLQRTYPSVNDIDATELMSGYYVGYEDDFKHLDQGYVATAEDVGVFLRALNDGSLLSQKEQEVYSSIYVYEHTGWVLGYYSIARYHPDIDTVVIQFVNTNGGETILLSDIVYGRVVDLVRAKEKG